VFRFPETLFGGEQLECSPTTPWAITTTGALASVKAIGACDSGQQTVSCLSGQGPWGPATYKDRQGKVWQADKAIPGDAGTAVHFAATQDLWSVKPHQLLEGNYLIHVADGDGSKLVLNGNYRLCVAGVEMIP